MRIHGGQSGVSNSGSWNNKSVDNQTQTPAAPAQGGVWGKGGGSDSRNQGDSYTASYDVAGQASAHANGRPQWGGGRGQNGSTTGSQGGGSNNPPPSNNTPTPTPPNPAPPAGNSGPTPSPPTGGNTPPGGSTASGGQVSLFGGSQSGENNIDFTNKSGADMYVYAQKNLEPGETGGGTVIKIPAGGKVTVNAVENKGLRFQKYSDTLTPEQLAELDKNGTVNGVTAPAKVGTLYETNYDPSKHLSWDDISPLDGADVPMTMSGNGGRTVQFTQAQIDGAPVHNPDGTVPGLGPDATSTGNAAGNPALRDYYAKISKKSDGTRDFYFNSSAAGEADKANVSYTGASGQVRTTVEWG